VLNILFKISVKKKSPKKHTSSFGLSRLTD